MEKRIRIGFWQMWRLKRALRRGSGPPSRAQMMERIEVLEDHVVAIMKCIELSSARIERSN